jgi:dinuclear metal center YbgI/SA1388 family protein
MKIKEIVELLEELAPIGLQEAYDNTGLIVGNYDNEIKAVLCTVDVTEEVIEEAIKLGANFIISHHPVLFGEIKSITSRTYIERIIVQAIKNDISLYSAHTNLDNISDGVNKILCEKIGLKNCSILSPMKDQLLKLVTFVPEKNANDVREALFKLGAGSIGNYDCCSYNIKGQGTFRGGENSNPFAGEKGKLHFENEIRIEIIILKQLINRAIEVLIKAHPYEEVAYDIYPLKNENNSTGAGMIGYLEKPQMGYEFMQNLKKIFNIPVIRYTGDKNKKLTKVAVCGGSGSFLIKKAIQLGADAFVTSDIKYHQFFDSENSIFLCDIGHYESEQFTKEIFYTFLIKKISIFAVHLSRIVTNPIKYYL